MKLIQTVTVGSGGAANIEFTSIPQTYTDLLVMTSLRTTGSNPGYYVLSFQVRLNNSTTGYTGKFLGGSGGGSAFSFDQNNAYVGWLPNVAATSNTFGNGKIYIPNYTSSNYKSLSCEIVSESNNSTEVYMALKSALWSNTSPVTSINIVPESGNFVEYSSVSLYGITKGSGGATAS